VKARGLAVCLTGLPLGSMRADEFVAVADPTRNLQGYVKSVSISHQKVIFF